MINKTLLEKEIRMLGLYDLVTFNGPNRPLTPVFSAEEQSEMKKRERQLLKQLSKIKNVTTE